MKISRKTALLMIIINITFILFSIATLFYRYSMFFNGGAAGYRQFTPTVFLWLNVIPGFLAIAIYVGLFWVMRRFKERKWLQSGLIIFVIFRLITIVSPFIFTRYTGVNFVSIHAFLMNFSVFYIAIMFALVQNVAIRWYYRAFAFLLMLCLFASSTASGMRDILGEGKVLVNTQVLFMLPFISSLLLFFKVYGISKTQKSTPNEISFKHTVR